MSTIERLTITLPVEMAAMIRSEVETGDYASTSEVIREALRDWKIKKEIQRCKLDALRRDIDEGLKDIEAGHTTDFDLDEIIEAGRRRSAARDASG